MLKLNKLAVAVASAAILGAVSPATQASDFGVTHVFDDGSMLQSFDDGSVVAFDSTGTIVTSLNADETNGRAMVASSTEETEGIAHGSAPTAFEDAVANVRQQVFDDGSLIQYFDDGSVIAYDSMGSHVVSLGPDESTGVFLAAYDEALSDELTLTSVYNCTGSSCVQVAQYEEDIA